VFWCAYCKTICCTNEELRYTPVYKVHTHYSIQSLALLQEVIINASLQAIIIGQSVKVSDALVRRWHYCLFKNVWPPLPQNWPNFQHDTGKYTHTPIIYIYMHSYVRARVWVCTIYILVFFFFFSLLRRVIYWRSRKSQKRPVV
jgi:hypothetical protein